MKSFKQYLKEDNFNLDAWLKELMQDSKRNYGYVDLDYVMMSLGYETPKKYSEKEIADRIKKLGFGSILKEDNWIDHYDKIVDLDLDRKTMSSKYKTRKDLEAAAAKAYGWDVKAEPYKTAFDKYFNESAKAIKEDSTKEALIKYAQKYGTPDEVTHIKGMTNDAAIRARYNWYLNEYGSLTEAKATHLTSIEMESTNSRLDWNFTSQGLTLGSMSGRPVTYYGDNEYRNFYNNSEQQDWTNWLKSSGQGIMKDLEKVADEFDKKVAQVLAKHGFKK